VVYEEVTGKIVVHKEFCYTKSILNLNKFSSIFCEYKEPVN